MNLDKERENLVAQRDNAFAVYNQAVGALALIDHLIEEEEKGTSMTMDEFKEAVGAESVEVEPLDKA